LPDDVVKLINAPRGGKIRLDRPHLGAHPTQIIGRILDLGLVGGDHEVISLLRRNASELIAYARRSPGDDGKSSYIGGHRYLLRG